MAEHDTRFEKIMESVGNNGVFQKRFNYVFNLAFVTCGAMAYMNILLALSVPDHWCHVPGRERTNFTVAQWKQNTLPMEIDARGILSVSSCHMYKVTEWTSELMHNQTEITSCQYGYEYDTTWYSRTAPSQENWVCDKEIYVTNVFVFSRIGEVIGTFVFGQLGDTLGRRPVFFISTVATLVGQIMIALTADWYSLFAISAVLGSFITTSAFQSVLIIAMEISKSEDRAHIAMLQRIGWTVGMCVMPLVLWAVRDWFVFMLITSLPLGLFLFMNHFLVESPKWLASRGKLAQSTAMLKKIAKANGTRLNRDALGMLKESSLAPVRVYGILSLFSSWRLAKNTILIILCWVFCSLCYFMMFLNVGNMAGNPFLNFLYQSVVELPAYIVGRISSDRIGRRWTSFGAYMVAAMTSIPLILIANNPDFNWMSSILAVIIKFCVSISFYVVYLQASETFPTCLRQTGISIGGTIANALGVLGPYIVYLGVTYDVRYPFLMLALMTLSGGMCSLFLPETRYQKLPETLDEAHIFGQDQRFWALPRNYSLTKKITE